jgi:hypothetical protein
MLRYGRDPVGDVWGIMTEAIDATKATEWARRVTNPTGLAVSLPICAFADEIPVGRSQPRRPFLPGRRGDGLIGIALSVAAVLITQRPCGA